MPCKYGTNRVIAPEGVLPQTAEKINNSMEIFENEVLIDVISLNIDSASFAQLKEEAGGDGEKVAAKIMEIVNARGKMQNPVTGSGGMLIGTVAKVGDKLKGRNLKVGDKIATLVSLSLTPLKINKINKIHMNIDRVDIDGQAVLFESGIYAVLPPDMPESLALAALDVAGAPAQTAKLVKPGDSVLVLGGGGKSGMMCCYEAKKRVGPTGNVVAVYLIPADGERLLSSGFCHSVIRSDVTRPLELMDLALAKNGGREFDISINCVNIPNSEMASILPVRDGGTVYFFSMAVSFSKAALGAEGVGKDVNMIIGNGYSKGHAEITLEILRESKAMYKIFEEKYFC